MALTRASTAAWDGLLAISIPHAALALHACRVSLYTSRVCPPALASPVPLDAVGCAGAPVRAPHPPPGPVRALCTPPPLERSPRLDACGHQHLRRRDESASAFRRSRAFCATSATRRLEPPWGCRSQRPDRHRTLPASSTAACVADGIRNASPKVGLLDGREPAFCEQALDHPRGAKRKDPGAAPVRVTHLPAWRSKICMVFAMNGLAAGMVRARRPACRQASGRAAWPPAPLPVQQSARRAKRQMTASKLSAGTSRSSAAPTRVETLTRPAARVLSRT